jgi:hypothetical protein
MIDIRGLDKAEVLKALYDASHPQGMGFMAPGCMSPLPIEAAREEVEQAKEFGRGTLYFDYVRGRVLKVDLTTDELDPWLYDRDNGAGAAQLVIDSMRNRT